MGTPVHDIDRLATGGDGAVQAEGEPRSKVRARHRMPDENGDRRRIGDDPGQVRQPDIGLVVGERLVIDDAHPVGAVRDQDLSDSAQTGTQRRRRDHAIRAVGKSPRQTQHLEDQIDRLTVGGLDDHQDVAVVRHGPRAYTRSASRRRRASAAASSLDVSPPMNSHSISLTGM